MIGSVAIQPSGASAQADQAVDGDEGDVVGEEQALAQRQQQQVAVHSCRLRSQGRARRSAASGAVSARSTRGPSVTGDEAARRSAAASSARRSRLPGRSASSAPVAACPARAQRPAAAHRRSDSSQRALSSRARRPACSQLEQAGGSCDHAARGCGRTARTPPPPPPASAPACVGALAGQAQHRALAHQRLDRRRAELGGLLDQRVHALVGRHADRQRARRGQLALDRARGADVRTRTSLRAMRVDARRPTRRRGRRTASARRPAAAAAPARGACRLRLSANSMPGAKTCSTWMRGTGIPRVSHATSVGPYFGTSRSSRRRILPTGVFGRSVRNSTTLGRL